MGKESPISHILFKGALWLPKRGLGVSPHSSSLWDLVCSSHRWKKKFSFWRDCSGSPLHNTCICSHRPCCRFSATHLQVLPLYGTLLVLAGLEEIPHCCYREAADPPMITIVGMTAPRGLQAFLPPSQNHMVLKKIPAAIHSTVYIRAYTIAPQVDLHHWEISPQTLVPLWHVSMVHGISSQWTSCFLELEQWFFSCWWRIKVEPIN